MALTTNPQLVSAINDLIEKNVESNKEQRDWLSGVFDGGPYLDGRYPITDFIGNVSYHKCPARIQWEADQALTAADGAKVLSEDARDTAVNSEATIALHRTAVEQVLTDTTAQRQLADNAKSGAQNHEANAKVYADNAESFANSVSEFDLTGGQEAYLAITSAIVTTSSRQLKQIIKDNPL